MIANQIVYICVWIQVYILCGNVSAIAIGNHVEDQCEEKLRGQRTASAEVSSSAVKLLSVGSAGKA